MPKEAISQTMRWLILIAAVSIFGLIFAAYVAVDKDLDASEVLEWTIGAKHTKTEDTTATKADSDTSTTEVAIDEYEGWKTYIIDDLKLSFRYPGDWGEPKLNSAPAETGTTKYLSFGALATEANKVVIGYASTDFTAGREGMFYEGGALSYVQTQYTDCATYKSRVSSGDTTLKTCSDITSGGKIIGILLSYDFGTGGMLEGARTVGYYFTGITNYPIVGMDTVDNTADMLAKFEKIIKSFKKV